MALPFQLRRRDRRGRDDVGSRARRPRRAAIGCARGRLPLGGSLCAPRDGTRRGRRARLRRRASPRAPSAAKAGALAPRRRGPRVRRRVRRHPPLDARGGRLAAAARSAGGLSQRVPGLRRAGPSRPAPDRARSRGRGAAGRRRPPRGRGGRVLEGFVVGAPVGPGIRSGGRRRARGRRLRPPSSARAALRQPRALSAARANRSADRRRRGGLATRPAPASAGSSGSAGPRPRRRSLDRGPLRHSPSARRRLRGPLRRLLSAVASDRLPRRPLRTRRARVRVRRRVPAAPRHDGSRGLSGLPHRGARGRLPKTRVDPRRDAGRRRGAAGAGGHDDPPRPRGPRGQASRGRHSRGLSGSRLLQLRAGKKEPLCPRAVLPGTPRGGSRRAFRGTVRGASAGRHGPRERPRSRRRHARVRRGLPPGPRPRDPVEHADADGPRPGSAAGGAHRRPRFLRRAPRPRLRLPEAAGP